jgi:pyruvate ferredoxin oxidoreductase gamma subunit
VNVLDPQRTLATSVLEIRGDGKAGGGLVLAFQSLAALALSRGDLHVQEWPFFSSARRGANIRSFLRVSAQPIAAACELTRPTVSLLMNEAAAQNVDFAQGVPPGGTFVINTRRTPEECALHFRLSGRVFTVPGDDLGARHLKHAIGNVSTYVALTEAIGGFDREAVVEIFLSMLKKRRIPQGVIDRNRDTLLASREAVQTGVFDLAPPGSHQPPRFTGYGDLPIGAQTPLRLSVSNPTAGYARSGFRLKFDDPEDACTGCAHCITNCPEGIIQFVPDPERVLKVTGVDVSTFCKLCEECIAVCPEKLFKDVPYEEVWEEVPATS